MDNKKILTLIVALVAIIGIGAVAYALLGHDDDDVVTYDANGGKSGDKTVWTDESDIVPIWIVVRDGYKFIEWNTSADGTGKTYNDGDPVSMGTRLYAVWGEPTVRFDTTFAPDFDFYLGSSDAGAPAPVKVAGNTDYAIPSNPVLRIVSKNTAENISVKEKEFLFTFADSEETIGFTAMFVDLGEMAVRDGGAELHFVVPYSSGSIGISHSLKDI